MRRRQAPRERDFLGERLEIIIQRRHAEAPGPQDVIRLQREERLLRKLLAEVEEGDVARALAAWRRRLGGIYGNHLRQEKPRREAFSAWHRQRRDERSHPRPPQPRLKVRYKDSNGYPWIIDQQLLTLLDDLARRLDLYMTDEKRMGTRRHKEPEE